MEIHRYQCLSNWRVWPLFDNCKGPGVPTLVRGETAISIRDFAGLRVFKDSCLPWVKGSVSDLVEELVEEARCQCGEVLSTHNICIYLYMYVYLYSYLYIYMYIFIYIHNRS